MAGAVIDGNVAALEGAETTTRVRSFTSRHRENEDELDGPINAGGLFKQSDSNDEDDYRKSLAS